jgi:hypothetical protein
MVLSINRTSFELDSRASRQKNMRGKLTAPQMLLHGQLEIVANLRATLDEYLQDNGLVVLDEVSHVFEFS